MTLAPVAQAIKALSFDQENAAADCGKRFAKNKLDRLEIASDFAKNLGTNPTFDQWENSRVKFIAGHAEETPDATSNAHDQAWNEFAKLLDSLYGLTKPKSTSPTAEKKALERAAAEEKLLEKYKHTPVVEIRDQLGKSFEKLAKNPENKDIKKLNKELDKVLKIKTSAENKVHGEELKRLRTEVKDAAGKCTDIEKLEAVLEILDEYTDLAYTIEDSEL
jgi:hypothetical protein